VKNICVVVVLRSTESDILLEQVVGRGLRLMFSEPEYADAKREAFRDLRRTPPRPPSNSFDFLFIVEHPRFRQFYEQLRQEGYIISGGDSGSVSVTGDLLTVEALSSRLAEFDLAWPVQFHDEGKPPDPGQVKVEELPRYHCDFAQAQHLSRIAITDVHVRTDRRVKTWKLDNDLFDYNYFLRHAADAVAREGKLPVLTGHKAAVMALLDDYVTQRLFGQAMDFTNPDRYSVLNWAGVYDHVVETVRRALVALLEKITFDTETRAEWRRVSAVPELQMRESASVPTGKSIYPRLGYPAPGGGFERDFMVETLEKSSEVLAYVKLERRHGLKIPYRSEYGVLREYEPDFLIKTALRMFLLETKATRDLELDLVALKARAGQGWCEAASRAAPPEGLDQPQEWEYLLLPEDLFRANFHLSFDAFVPMCRDVSDRVIANASGRLF
jgi:type III restriction enzyme